MYVCFSLLEEEELAPSVFKIKEEPERLLTSKEGMTYVLLQ